MKCSAFCQQIKELLAVGLGDNKELFDSAFTLVAFGIIMLRSSNKVIVVIVYETSDTIT